MRWLDGIIDSMDVSLSQLRAMVKDRDTRSIYPASKKHIVMYFWAAEYSWAPDVFLGAPTQAMAGLEFLR